MAAPAVEAFGSDRMWGLKEPPLPEVPAFVPATPAWGLLALLIVMVGFAIRRARRSARARDAWRREALRCIERMHAGDLPIETLPGLLRRCMRVASPPPDVLTLRGTHWCEWLNAHGGAFDDDMAETLDRLPYAPDAGTALSAGQRARLLGASRAWIAGFRPRAVQRAGADRSTHVGPDAAAMDRARAPAQTQARSPDNRSVA